MQKPSEQFALSYSSGPWQNLVCVCQSLSCVPLFETSWSAACQAPLSIEFSRQEYWCGLPFPSQGIFLTQGLNPHLLHYQEDSLPLSHVGSPPGRIRDQQSPLMANPSEQQPSQSKPVGSSACPGPLPLLPASGFTPKSTVCGGDTADLGTERFWV